MPTPRNNIQKLAAYAPGEQPAQSVKVIKLNTNESPYPPSPKAVEALGQVPAEALRVYPPPLAQPFRRAAAEVHGVSPEQVIATNGGDELLRLLITTYCQPSGSSGGGGLGVTVPSYSLYPVLAAIHDTPVCAVERTDDFALAEDLAQQWNDAGCTLAMLVNPHAPTGRCADLEALRAIALQFEGLLMIDEAYVNFAQADALPLVREGISNVILLRSMSKGYGLAGLRFGYGLGSADTIAALDKARDSYNTDIVSQHVATAALLDQAYAREVWRDVIDARQSLTAALRDRGFLVRDSQTNFVLAAPPSATDKPDARTLYTRLKERGILVRYFDLPRLDDKLRITIGTPEQNHALLKALDDLM
ncbi:MAG: histidinol-phosphate transaminase [Phycisphaerales bacterium JB063]